jgi:hypothetical protein
MLMMVLKLTKNQVRNISADGQLILIGVWVVLDQHTLTPTTT